MGRSVLDPGTLRAVQSSPLTSLNVHFVWSEGMASAPMFSSVLGSLKDWLGNWLGETNNRPGLANIDATNVEGEKFRAGLWDLHSGHDSCDEK